MGLEEVLFLILNNTMVVEKSEEDIEESRQLTKVLLMKVTHIPLLGSDLNAFEDN